MLFAFFFELFAGGGGRLIAIGPVSIRQEMFAFVLFVFIIRFFINKQTRLEVSNYFFKHNTAVFWLSLLMVVWIVFSAICGVTYHHPIGMVITDSFRVIFVIMIIPIIYYIDENRFTKKDFLNVLFWATLFVSLLTIIISVWGKLLDNHQFYYFYRTANSLIPADLFFRPSRGVFYKSLFLVLFTLIIASVEFMNHNLTKFHALIAVFGAIAVVLSETRGLYLGYLIGLLVYLLVRFVIRVWGKPKHVLNYRRIIRNVVFLIVAIGATLYFYTNSTISRFSVPDDSPAPELNIPNESGKGQIHDSSMNVRVVLLHDSVKLVKKSPTNLFFGNGYGTTIGKRKTGIEMTFIDIMVEQGLVGVLIWLAFSLLPLLYYFKAFLKHHDLENDDIALLGCTLAMIVMTNINPFLNSPIGLGFLLPVIVVSFKLSRSRSAENE